MLLSNKDLGFRNIITRAVCARGNKYCQITSTMHPTNEPTSIGGCWVMNHKFEAQLKGEVVDVQGSFDCNVWYSYKGNSETAVAKDTIVYTERIPLANLDPNCFPEKLQVVTTCVEQPNCLDATIGDGPREILVRVELELGYEVTGETKVCVVVCNQLDLADKKDEEMIADDDLLVDGDDEDEYEL